jgi:hypothetical protein
MQALTVDTLSLDQPLTTNSLFTFLKIFVKLIESINLNGIDKVMQYFVIL